MPIAVIALDFDPILRLGDITIRWQAVALAVALLAGLVLTGLLARRLGLRPDDLLLIAVGAVPGAVVGGRLGHVVGHLEYYADHTGAIVDPAQGSVTLSLAVVGGVLTGGVVAQLLGTPIRPWLHAVVVPLLLVLAVGKLTMVLGGSGQGVPADHSWATAYVGPGPWGSLAPGIPSHPAQVYEAIAAGVAAIVIAVGSRAFDPRSGRAFLIGVGLWAVGRVVVGATWRDAQVLGPLRAEQLLAIGVAVGCVLLAIVARRPAELDRHGRRDPEPSVPQWPDPSTRPRF